MGIISIQLIGVVHKDPALSLGLDFFQGNCCDRHKMSPLNLRVKKQMDVLNGRPVKILQLCLRLRQEGVLEAVAAATASATAASAAATSTASAASARGGRIGFGIDVAFKDHAV